MTDHSDLIAELRTIAEYVCWDKFEDRFISDPKKHPAWRAADALSSQSLSLSEAREEIERLRKERDDLLRAVQYAQADLDSVEGLKELLAGIRAAPQEPWQDISTAPKDGTRFLATGGGLGSHIDFASYNDRVGCWNTTDFTLDDTDHEPEGYSRPTRWMPLPAAPGSALENGPAGLADAHSNPPLSDLSSLRKGAEDMRDAIEDAIEDLNTYRGAAVQTVIDRLEAALVSGSREDGDG